MDESKQQVKSVTIGDNEMATVIIEVPIKEFAQKEFVDYQVTGDIKKRIVELLAEKVLDERGDTILSEVLTDVNWPEIVRSEIAQKLIKAIASGSLEEKRGY